VSPTPQQPSFSKAQIITWALALVPIGVSVYACSISSDAQSIASRALQVAEHQAEINQKNHDRAAGKVAAKFDFVDLQGLNHPEWKKPFNKRFANGEEAPRIDDVEELVRWAPRVGIQNTGEEIIDTVKIEVGYFGRLRINPDEKDLAPSVTLTDPATVREVALPGKLSPGQEATIFLLPFVAEQMGALAKVDRRPDVDRRDVFNVRVLARIVGAPNGSYDASYPRRDLRLHVNWRAKGFTDAEKCKKATLQEVFTIIR
jgi:hypothetical protein